MWLSPWVWSMDQNKLKSIKAYQGTVEFYVLKLVDSKYNQLTVINKVFYYLISISVIDYFISFVLITQIQ